MTNHETRALRAVLTVTVETRSDGGHYFDQADFTAHVAEWVRSSLRNKHAVGDVAVVEAAAVSVPPPAPRADALREAADFLRDAHFRDGLSVQEIGTAMRHWADREEQPSAGEQQNETPEAEAPVVAYRSRDSRSLYCTAHAGELFGLSYEPVTAEDLPDGGICMYPDCGRDVLAGPRP